MILVLSDLKALFTFADAVLRAGTPIGRMNEESRHPCFLHLHIPKGLCFTPC